MLSRMTHRICTIDFEAVREPVEAALFDQIQTKPAKAEPYLVVSEVHRESISSRKSRRRSFTASNTSPDVAFRAYRDRDMFVLMLIEILHTVRGSVRSGELTPEPFLIVGLIASIRNVLVITSARTSSATTGGATSLIRSRIRRSKTLSVHPICQSAFNPYR
jgi:Phosphate-starvation-inducible E family